MIDQEGRLFWNAHRGMFISSTHSTAWEMIAFPHLFRPMACSSMVQTNMMAPSGLHSVIFPTAKPWTTTSTPHSTLAPTGFIFTPAASTFMASDDVLDADDVD